MFLLYFLACQHMHHTYTTAMFYANVVLLKCAHMYLLGGAFAAICSNTIFCFLVLFAFTFFCFCVISQGFVCQSFISKCSLHEGCLHQGMWYEGFQVGSAVSCLLSVVSCLLFCAFCIYIWYAVCMCPACSPCLLCNA